MELVPRKVWNRVPFPMANSPRNRHQLSPTVAATTITEYSTPRCPYVCSPAE